VEELHAGGDLVDVLAAMAAGTHEGFLDVGVEDSQCGQAPGQLVFLVVGDGMRAHFGRVNASPAQRPSVKKRTVKHLTEHLWFEVPDRRGYLNITETVAQLVRQSGIQEGLCLVNAMHITASVYINDDESGLIADYDAWLEKLAPHEPVSGYRHNRTGEDNADAHLKRQIMGREVVVAVTKGKLDLGPWEQVFYGEFDGRRRKRVLVKIIGE
jgi:secondary thiamine-phosphate synthase enzyme